MDDCAVKMVRV